MNQPTRSEAITRLLIAKTHADLASLYSLAMECQVNVAQDNGEVIEGEFKGREYRAFTDGITTWKTFRIPHNAKTAPEYEESPMSFDLEKHAEGIGMTGWDWQACASRWVAFDFDAIVGHSDKHSKKLDPSQIEEVLAAAAKIPWVTIRKSTSGRGVHLYVFLTPIETKTHTEHAALARAILGQLSAITGFDFSAKVDNCGGIMWVWHRKMTSENQGLVLVKQGEILKSVPENWKSHVKVITNQRPKTLPQFVEGDEAERIFQELCGQHVQQPLDADHKRLIDWLTTNGAIWWWDNDNHMLVTHTVHLKDAHAALGAKGVFDTDSKHTSQQNCFLYPLRHGAWSVRRYTAGIKEHDSWEQDGQGWTRCYFNREPDLASVARVKGGIEHPSGGWVFREAELAVEAISQLGASLPKDLPPWARGRQAKVRPHKDGQRLVIELKKESSDDGASMPKWLPEKDSWKIILNTKSQIMPEPEVANFDDVVRHLVTGAGEDYGWVIRSDNQWREEPLAHIKAALETQGINAKDQKLVVGGSIFRPWTITNDPFKPEYPGDRIWNRKAAQLKFLPSASDNLSYPGWMKILKHCGESLDEALAKNPWAKANSVQTGADYLKLWIASLLQDPTQPLPYLFFHGAKQNTGKSMFHEALELIIANGVARARDTLSNKSGFNAEILNAVLCIVEELDMSHDSMAYGRIKDWVTALYISIHPKGQTPYTVRNISHWVQCANSADFCPIFPGDTRVTMMYVDSLDPLELIPKKIFLAQLLREAPDFIAELLRVEIPSSNDRLNVPVITTEEKLSVEDSNKSYLDKFIEEICFNVPGEWIKYSELYDRFCEWLPADELISRKWTKNLVGRMIPKSKYPKGRSPKDGQWFIGNISFMPYVPGDPVKPKLVVKDEKLIDEAAATTT